MPTENQSNTALAPRPGKEFWDKLNALPRYMFLLKPSDAGIQKLEDRAGNWIDVHEAQKVVDQAQDRIGELQEAYVAAGERGHVLREEREALQQRLTSADERLDKADDDFALLSLEAGQRIDDLEELLNEARRSVDYHAGMQREDGGDRLYGLLARISAALKPEKVERCDEIPGTSGMRLNMLANQGE